MILQASREKNVFIQKINNQNALGFSIATLKAQSQWRDAFKVPKENGFQLEFYTQLSVYQMGK